MKTIYYFILFISLLSVNVQADNSRRGLPEKLTYDQIPSNIGKDAIRITDTNANGISVGVAYKKAFLDIPFNTTNTVFFYWSEDLGFVVLPELGQYARKPKINSNNEIAGMFLLRTYIPFKYRPALCVFDLDGYYTELPTPTDWPLSKGLDRMEVVAFNSLRDVVVTNWDENEFAVWRNGKYTHLDRLNIRDVFSINDQGVILFRVKGKMGYHLYDIDSDTVYSIPGGSSITQVQLKEGHQVTYKDSDGKEVSFNPDTEN